MSKYRHIHIVTFAVLLIMPSSALAWGAKGHQIVEICRRVRSMASVRVAAIASSGLFSWENVLLDRAASVFRFR
jgi:hypothetical protein